MKKFFLVLLIQITVFQLFSQSYKIELKIKGVKSQQVILGVHKGENLVPVDTTKTDANGYGVFQKNKKLIPGMYIIFLPSRTYFDIIVGEDQTFLIENDTANLYKNLKISNSTEGEIFVDYQKFLVEQTEKMNKLNEQYKIEKDENKKKDIENQMNKISENYEQKFNSIITQNPNNFFSKFLKATREVKVPAEITDNMQQYQYYKNHYFDNFDLSDISMLYTPIYDNKIDTYLDKVAPPMPDSINYAIDFMLNKAKANADLYQYLLIKLYNKYAKSQLMISENIFVHIAEIYVEKAIWSPDSFRNELKTKIVRKKNCLIGNTAQNMKLFVLPNDSLKIKELRIPLEDMKNKGLEIEKDKSRTFDQKLPDLSALIAEFLSHFPTDTELKNVQAKYTILWFISPTCSHCVEETPKFYDQYNKLLKDKGVVVFSVLLEANTDNWFSFSNTYSQWFDFVIKHKMFAKGWYNLSNPFDNFRFKYDISSSPVLYLLDKDKKIIAKRIGYEQAVEIILDLENPKNQH